MGRGSWPTTLTDKSEGIYAVIDMLVGPDTVRKLDHQLGLNEVVLGTRVTRPLELFAGAREEDEEAPSAEVRRPKKQAMRLWALHLALTKRDRPLVSG